MAGTEGRDGRNGPTGKENRRRRLRVVKGQPLETPEKPEQAAEESERFTNPTEKKLAEKFDELAEGKVSVNDDLREIAIKTAAKIVDLPIDEVEGEIGELDRQATEELLGHPILAAYKRKAGGIAGQLDESRRYLSDTEAARFVKHEIITRTVAEALILHEVGKSGRVDRERSEALLSTGMITHDHTPGLFTLLDTTWQAAQVLLNEKKDPPPGGAKVVDLFEK